MEPHGVVGVARVVIENKFSKTHSLIVESMFYYEKMGRVYPTSLRLKFGMPILTEHFKI